MWGHRRKLEIHLRPADRSMMVKIPNEVIIKKIVEQEIWYIENSLFYVAQWSPNLAIKPPTIESIPLWVHVRGVPSDLRTQEGLSLVAGLFGEPLKTGEYTKRLTNKNVAHVKIKADCSKPLPLSVELLRDDGSVISISAEYPWLPPTCPNCNQLGHLQSKCPTSKWTPTSVGKDRPPASNPTPATNQKELTSQTTIIASQSPIQSSQTQISSAQILNPPSNHPFHQQTT